MTTAIICRDIENYINCLDKLKIETFPSLIEIFLKSILPEDSIYDQIIIMSVKTSNNYDTIRKMPFNKFNKLSKALNRYIEAENKREGNSTEFQNEYDNMMTQQKSMMSGMKNSFKMPKLK